MISNNLIFNQLKELLETKGMVDCNIVETVRAFRKSPKGAAMMLDYVKSLSLPDVEKMELKTQKHLFFKMIEIHDSLPLRQQSLVDVREEWQDFLKKKENKFDNI